MVSIDPQRGTPFDRLACPYCGDTLQGRRPTRAGPVPAEESYAILRCSCSTFPVVEGIPILQHKEGIGRIVEAIEQRDNRAALLRALNAFRVTWARRSRAAQLLYRYFCTKTVDADCSFEEAIYRLRQPKVFADYLFHRWANPSFLGAIAPMIVLGRLVGSQRALHDASLPLRKTPAPPVILDLACGTGHTSDLMHALHPALVVVSADHDFVSLYLARRFLAPAGMHICVDAELPLPFSEDSFAAVFCLDAVHYLHAKRSVGNELRRVGCADALFVLPHLHHASQHNMTAGMPLLPHDYARILGLENACLLAEDTLLDDFVERDVLNLTRSASSESLAGSPALTLIAGPERMRTEHRGLAASLVGIGRPLVANPIYTPTASGGRRRLQLAWPNPMMGEECAGVTRWLPASVEVETALAGAESGAPAEDLVRRFITVPLPPGYGRKQ